VNRSGCRASSPASHWLAGFALDSIEVSATGKVSLLGSGGKASATGGFTFKHTRRRAEPNVESARQRTGDAAIE
jgi:hypothetical protein